MLNFNEKIIFKKFLLDNTYFFLFVAISLTLIVWVIQAVNFLDFVSEDGHSFKVYFYYTLLNLPRIFSKVIPVVFFISIFYSLIKYEENNELKIFWINGINKIKFLNVLIKYTFLFFILQILLSGFLTPITQNSARSFIKNSNLDFFPSLLKEKKFIDTVDKLTIFIDSKNDAENTFKNIYLKDQVDTQQSKIIFAKTGKLIDVLGVRTLRLYGGVFINVNDNKTTIFNFDKTDFDLSNFGTKSVTYRKIQERDSRSLLSCLSNFYMNNVDFVEIPGVCNKDFIIEIKQEIFKRFFKPLYLFVVIMIVSFLLISYRENIIYKSIKSIIFIVAIISLAASEISISYFGRDNFSSIITALIPLLLFLFLYFVLIKKLSFNEIKKQ
jgi:lipopolysaccharide export system permease protein